MVELTCVFVLSQLLRDRKGREAEQGHDPQVVGGVHKAAEERADAHEAERAEAQAARAPEPSATASHPGARAPSQGPRTARVGLELGHLVRESTQLLRQEQARTQKGNLIARNTFSFASLYKQKALRNSCGRG